MRKYLIFAAALILAGCGPSEADLISANGAEGSPRLPSLPAPSSESKPQLSMEELERELQKINSELQRPNISKLDLQQGWYYGPEKKYGTPSSWVFVEKDNRWMSPLILEGKELRDARTLCKETAGSYVVSCIDSDNRNCEQVSETSCTCIEGSKWNREQGCLMTDEEGEWVRITQQELTRGWYHGLPNEKKLGTPDNWIWFEDGPSSRWKHPRI